MIKFDLRINNKTVTMCIHYQHNNITRYDITKYFSYTDGLRMVSSSVPELLSDVVYIGGSNERRGTSSLSFEKKLDAIDYYLRVLKLIFHNHNNGYKYRT